MKKDELMGKELANLYAMAKQVNQFFADRTISFLSDYSHGLLSQYRAVSRNNENQVLESLRRLEINPGNTVDSVVREILENLNDILSKKDLEDDVREMAFVMSLNRLVHYHMASMANLEYGTEAL
ncbi:hypothetical protein [Maribacter sp. 2307ULW6-5]|uniref:hypothetical protein n=1 Tax=Maribacter sp. 2307ULW6-5 TaxID=3386275 RepID=UPI0039BC237E